MTELLLADEVGLIEEARVLFKEYSAGLGVDLCFQNFDKELAELPGDYAAPRGLLLVAMVDGKVGGCCALRPRSSDEHPDAAEMKRLYVRPEFRGTGLGKKLVDELMMRASNIGYRAILLDTLPSMSEAQQLYQRLGFVEIPPYYPNPGVGAKYLKRDLQKESSRHRAIRVCAASRSSSPGHGTTAHAWQDPR